LAPGAFHIAIPIAKPMPAATGVTGYDMPDKAKTLREELEAEFAGLKGLGVTEEELEALYEQCGLKPRRVLVLNTGRAKARP
jgi:hypothetical protein